MIRRWVLAVSLVLVTALAGAGFTLALFSDSTNAGSQRIVAGTVRIDGDRVYDTVRGPMFYIDGATDGLSDSGEEGFRPTGLWAPGDAHHRVFHVENVGSLEAKIVSLSAALQSGDAELADILEVRIYDGAYLDADGVPTVPAPTLIYEGKLSEFFGSGVTLAQPILLDPYNEEWGGGGVAEFGILVSFPLDAGNDYQGKSIKVTFSAYAEQARNN